MANGLLDFFGKDYEDPRTQGLLQFGLGLMQQGGYQDRPVSLGQAFGAAGQQGMQAYQAAQKAAREKQQAEQMQAMRDLQMAQTKLQMRQAEQAAKDKEIADKRAAQQRAYVMQAVAPTMSIPSRDEAGKISREDRELMAVAMGKNPLAALGYRDAQAAAAADLAYKEAQTKALTTPKPPKSLDFKKQSVTVGNDQGEAMVAYVPIDSAEAKKYGADEFGMIIKPGTFTPEGSDKSYEISESILTVNNVPALGTQVYTEEIDGVQVTKIRDSETGQFRTPDPAKGELIMSKQAISDAKASPKDMTKYKTDFDKEIQGIDKIGTFYDLLEDNPEGFEKGINTVTSAFKTLIGQSGKLTEDELRQKFLVGLQQGLLGDIRIDVLGPGVLTEIDAQRLLAAMGGDLKSMTVSNESVRNALGQMLHDKINRFNDGIVGYNAQVDLGHNLGGHKKYDELQPFAAPTFTSSLDSSASGVDLSRSTYDDLSAMLQNPDISSSDLNAIQKELARR